MTEAARRENLSIAALARRTAAGQNSRSMTGSGGEVADMMQTWFDAGACDGFVVSAPYLPGALEGFVDHVIPVLQGRGLFRNAYEGVTLRGNLGLHRPVSQYSGGMKHHVEPEIW